MPQAAAYLVVVIQAANLQTLNRQLLFGFKYLVVTWVYSIALSKYAIPGSVRHPNV